MGPPILSVLRISVGRFSNGKNSQLMSSLSLQNQNMPSSESLRYQQNRTIVNQALLKLPADYPEPWPYKERGYNWIDMHFDRTKKRFHENSKLIILEGNVGSGKTKIGKEIADLLGFRYMPEFKMDDILIDRYGNDMRNFYNIFPKRFRVPDTNLFFKNPYDNLSAVMQDRFYFCRWEQYLNALTHIYNTGEGIILERSVYADFVFANAMRAKNYIGPEYFKHYHYLRKMTLPALELYPHLLLYIDCPVSKCLENIKKRGNEDEIRIVDAEYLNVMAESYKDLIRDLKRHSRVLIYDWSNPANVDNIIEDIEGLEFDFFNWHGGDVLETWNMAPSELLETMRRLRFTEKTPTQSFEYMRNHETGELYIHPEDAALWTDIMKIEVLKSPYGYGCGPNDGYKGMGLWRWDTSLPEKWVEYFFKEKHFVNMAGANRYSNSDSGDYEFLKFNSH